MLEALRTAPCTSKALYQALVLRHALGVAADALAPMSLARPAVGGALGTLPATPLATALPDLAGDHGAAHGVAFFGLLAVEHYHGAHLPLLGVLAAALATLPVAVLALACLLPSMSLAASPALSDLATLHLAAFT